MTAAQTVLSTDVNHIELSSDLAPRNRLSPDVHGPHDPPHLDWVLSAKAPKARARASTAVRAPTPKRVESAYPKVVLTELPSLGQVSREFPLFPQA